MTIPTAVLRACRYPAMAAFLALPALAVHPGGDAAGTDPTRDPGVEAACAKEGARTQESRVSVPWLTVSRGQHTLVQYCVLRGERTASLDFQRNAEIVVGSPGTELEFAL